MNNINSTGQNVEPGKKGGGEGDKLTYDIRLLALLGLGFYRWCWQRDTQRQIQEVESKCTEELKVVFKEMDKEKREKEHLKSKEFLNMVEKELMERQHVYCSSFISKEFRLERERKLLNMVAGEPLAKGLDMEADLKNIFEKDQYCAYWLNKDKHKNGRLMWSYLRSWQQQISLQQYKKATAAPVKQQSDLK